MRLLLGRNNLWLYAEKFYLEDQGRKRLDLSCLTGAVTQLLRNIDFPRRTYRHLLNGFRPSFDDLRAFEGHGLIALIAAVEHGAVNQFSFIVHLHGGAGRRLFARALLYHLILNTARQCLHARLLGILAQPLLSGATILAILFFHEPVLVELHLPTGHGTGTVDGYRETFA